MCKDIVAAKVNPVWTIPLLQGYISNFQVYIQGKKLDFYLLARRSCKKAGTRYNSRGNQAAKIDRSIKRLIINTSLQVSTMMAMRLTTASSNRSYSSINTAVLIFRLEGEERDEYLYFTGN